MTYSYSLWRSAKVSSLAQTATAAAVRAWLGNAPLLPTRRVAPGAC